eukprot:CAMPEP_0194340262 /NCGR_PEP_ID=MMETSP0171-20130528/85702_1 /TAXON_ID=218684 /ORGANISM="Corethron pennatum, Strain L29A3" /LENGTH=163 /DNA_ID=CAMNT_0039105141 /DNA_START=6 /DNA_END=493 /DNA_ORIENTATION=+
MAVAGYRHYLSRTPPPFIKKFYAIRSPPPHSFSLPTAFFFPIGKDPGRQPPPVCARRWKHSSARPRCPYSVLGVERGADYASVRAAFLELAVRHHPDTSTHPSPSADAFVDVRAAFEEILAPGDEGARSVATEGRREEEEKEEDARRARRSFRDWFYSNTGLA